MPSALFQQYAPLLAVFSSQGQSELVLLQKVQEYCYDNIHFMKAFQKIVVLFYKGTVTLRPSASVLYRSSESRAGQGRDHQPVAREEPQRC